MTLLVGEATESRLDKPASEWTSSSLHQVYLTYVCAIVRSVIETDRALRMKELIRLAYLAKGDPVHVDHNDIINVGEGNNPSPYDLIEIPLLKGFLELVYRGHGGYHPQGVVARRIRGEEPGTAKWQPPLGLHLDAFFHYFDWTVNFWIPFDACGVESPCLQFVPIDYQTTRRFSQFSEESLFEAEYRFGHFPKGALAVDRITAEFGPACFYRPKLNIGDLIISSNWIIHGTYKTPEMRRGRTSIEIRFIGTKRDPSPALLS